MDEIKRLKLMLEGKAPIDHTAIAATMNGEGSSPIIQERIIYKDGEDK